MEKSTSRGAINMVDESSPIDSDQPAAEHSYTNSIDISTEECAQSIVRRNDLEDEQIITMLQSKVNVKKLKPGTIVSIHVLRGQTKEEFIEEVLKKAYDDGLGTFNMKKIHATSPMFHCARHGVPNRKERQSGPLNTRANGCPAYISFTFKYLSVKGLWAATVRTYPEHSGHDPNDPEHLKVNRIDPELREYIENLLAEGVKPMEILVLCWGWSQSKNQFDFRDRRYYPIPEDLKTIRRKRKVHNEVLKQAAKGSLDPVRRRLYNNYIDELIKAGRLKPKEQNAPKSTSQKKRKQPEPEDSIVEDTSHNDSDCESSLISDDNTIHEIEVVTVDYRQQAKQQLIEIFGWLDSDQYQDCRQSKQILDQIETLHSTIFCNFQS